MNLNARSVRNLCATLGFVSIKYDAPRASLATDRSALLLTDFASAMRRLTLPAWREPPSDLFLSRLSRLSVCIVAVPYIRNRARKGGPDVDHSEHAEKNVRQ
eukprot:383996-Pleurochrysis_carterae.AAC.4